MVRAVRGKGQQRRSGRAGVDVRHRPGVPADPARAAALLEQAAERGHPRAHHHFALHLLDGTGVPENRVMAETHLRQAALAGYRPAIVALARLMATVSKRRNGGGGGQCRRPRGAIYGSCEVRTRRGGSATARRCRPLVREGGGAGPRGGPSSTWRILRLTGSGIERDPALAAAWFARAAQQEMVQAEIRLAQLHFTGEGVPQDHLKAAELLRRPAAAGYSEAETLLAGLYLSGSGVAPDRAEAERLLRSASGRVRPSLVAAWPSLCRRSGLAGEARGGGQLLPRRGRAGSTGGAIDRGENLLAGHWGERKPDEAAVWFRKAAEAGHAGAQFQLGVMYGAGLGMPADPAVSAAWYRRAAEQGERTAQYNLAVMLMRGDGVERDPDAAMVTSRSRAGPGGGTDRARRHPCQGHRVAADTEAACGWYEKAAAQGHAPAQSRLAALRGPVLVATVQPLQARGGGG